MIDGYISLHRKIINHWVYKNPDHLKAWITILMAVNHIEAKVLIGEKLYICERGECLYSLDTWAKKFGRKWNKSKVRRFFILLQSDHMIVTKGEQKTTRLRVCNYEGYQAQRNANETQVKRKRNASETQVTPSNNDNKDNNDNKKEKPLTDLPLPDKINPQKSDTPKSDPPKPDFSFEKFWDGYDKKYGDKNRIQKKWEALTDEVKIAAGYHIAKYKIAQPNKQFRKNPETYINQKSWNDEIIYASGIPPLSDPVWNTPIVFQGSGPLAAWSYVDLLGAPIKKVWEVLEPHVRNKK